MAPTGQAGTQVPQPTHWSGSMVALPANLVENRSPRTRTVSGSARHPVQFGLGRGTRLALRVKTGAAVHQARMARDHHRHAAVRSPGVAWAACSIASKAPPVVGASPSATKATPQAAHRLR